MHAEQRPLWTVPPEYLRLLRIEAARSALDAGNADLALVEAEELLESDRDNQLALGIVGAAALKIGNAVLASEAYGRLLELRPDDAETHAVLAMARFGMADLQGALDAATIATALRPDLAEGWYYAGLAGERLRRTEQAERAFARARDLAPQTYPASSELGEIQWDEALSQAGALLPPPLQQFYGGVPTRWEQFPELDELLAVDPPLSPFTDALYDGVPPVEGDPWEERPGAIRLFRGNLCRPNANKEELAERIARALVHEALDWLGLSYDEVVAGHRAADPS